MKLTMREPAHHDNGQGVTVSDVILQQRIVTLFCKFQNQLEFLFRYVIHHTVPWSTMLCDAILWLDINLCRKKFGVSFKECMLLIIVDNVLGPVLSKLIIDYKSQKSIITPPNQL